MYINVARALDDYEFWSFSKEPRANERIRLTARVANENILLTSVKDCSAQDPVFNTLDKQLLESTGIRVVEHPVAFTLINDRTFLYSPGAERVHLLDMLASNPTLFFGGPLDDGTLVGLYDIELFFFVTLVRFNKN